MADLTTTDLTTQPVGANLGVATTMPVSGFQPMPSTWEDYQAQQGPMMTMDIKPWQTGEYSGMSAKDAYESYANNYNANPSANYIGDVGQMPVGTGGLSSLLGSATPTTAADVAKTGLSSLGTNLPATTSPVPGGMDPTKSTEYTLSSWYAP